jgi:4-hydroxybenzoate polyprenyltransferase
MSRGGYRALAANGTEYARRVLRGEERILTVPFWSFAVELALALRPHFFAMSSLAALAGAASVPEIGCFGVIPPRGLPRDLYLQATPATTLAALTCGLGWGVGQIVNDLMDRESDAVNAPDRAISAGRLPPGPALLFAIVLGAIVSLATIFVHHMAWVFVPIAALLLVFYNAAKKLPALGNVAHAALMSIAAAIGVSSRIRIEDWDSRLTMLGFLRRVLDFYPMLLAVGATAAWYLQANYEKDRPGDRAAGYMTLAVVMPVRASAALRAATIVAIGVAAHAMGLVPDAVSKVTMVAAIAVGLVSTIGPIVANTDAAALRAYRFAVVASILCMLALAAPLLGRWGTTAMLVASLVLVRAAFRRSENP